MKNQIINLLIKNNKIAFFTALAIVMLLFSVSIILTSYISQTLKIPPPINLDKTELFIGGDVSSLDMNGFEQVFSFSNSNVAMQEILVETDLEYSNFSLDETTSKQMMQEIGGYKDDFSTYLLPNFTSDIVASTGIPNAPYQFNRIILGTYPTTSDEVLVGEFIANTYMNQYQYDNLSEILNQTIDLIVDDVRYQFKIVGITEGNSNFITDSSFELFTMPQPKDVDFYKNFDSVKQKKEFITSNDLAQKGNNIVYYDSDSFNYINVYLWINIISLLISLGVYWIIMYRPVKQNYSILSYYGYEHKHLLLFFWPLIISIIVISCYILLYCSSLAILY